MPLVTLSSGWRVALRVVFWLACIGVTVLSLLPGPYLPRVAFDVWDKAQHASAFLALGLIGLIGLPAFAGHERRVVIGLLACGAAIEFAQAATGWRWAA